MKNPFNTDHWHESDPTPHLHAALEHLIAHEKTLRQEDEDYDGRSPIAMSIDLTLNSCTLNECCYCAAICCPKGDEMHFHHDGCPSCE